MRTRYTYDTVAHAHRAMPAACTSSGSWAPTTCAASTAGRSGAASPTSLPIAVVDRVGPSLYATAGARGAGAVALPHPGAGRKVAAAPQAARVGLPARLEVAALLHGVARTPSQIMDALTAFGLLAVTAMLVFYALEDRSPWFILAFAGACALGSIYGFLQGAWPFGVIEAIWAGVAARRWALRRQPMIRAAGHRRPCGAHRASAPADTRLESQSTDGGGGQDHAGE